MKGGIAGIINCTDDLSIANLSNNISVEDVISEDDHTNDVKVDDDNTNDVKVDDDNTNDADSIDDDTGEVNDTLDIMGQCVKEEQNTKYKIEKLQKSILKNIKNNMIPDITSEEELISEILQEINSFVCDYSFKKCNSIDQRAESFKCVNNKKLFGFFSRKKIMEKYDLSHILNEIEKLINMEMVIIMHNKCSKHVICFDKYSKHAICFDNSSNKKGNNDPLPEYIYHVDTIKLQYFHRNIFHLTVYIFT